VDNSSFKKANAFIEYGGGDLQTVYAKIHVLQELNRKILIYLDKDMAKYCQVANLVGGKLTLIVANGSIATQLRFQVNDILRKFHQDSSLKHILSIEFKVRPTQNQDSPRLRATTAKNMPALSPETADIVKTIAESIEDPVLKEVMARIAMRVK